MFDSPTEGVNNAQFPHPIGQLVGVVQAARFCWGACWEKKISDMLLPGKKKQI